MATLARHETDPAMALDKQHPMQASPVNATHSPSPNLDR
jgi:hypothetical protein